MSILLYVEVRGDLRFFKPIIFPQFHPTPNYIRGIKVGEEYISGKVSDIEFSADTGVTKIYVDPSDDISSEEVLLKYFSQDPSWTSES